MNVVVGSGPSGVFAAAALLARGEPVTLLDVGRTLDAGSAARVGVMAAREPDAWTDDERAFLRGASALDPRLPKASYGSTFPYALDALDGWEQRGTRCLHSHARGGLSNVWGAALLPYRARDVAGWPVGVDDLAPHYAAVTARLGVGGDDELADDFPTYGPLAPAAPLSRQAARVYERMAAHRAALRGAGVTFGRARLALRTRPDDPRRCRLSGRCHDGCPYGSIWNASELLDALCRDGRMSYRPGVQVERVEPVAGGVRVHGRRADGDGGAVVVAGARAFLGCGPVGTAQVVAASLGRGALDLPLASQPYFLLPMAMLDGGVGDVEGEALHTLAQLFVELDDPRVSRHGVHLQVYTYNSLIRDRVGALAGPLGAGPRRALTRRLVAVQGYLHSDEGAPVALRVGPGSVSLRAAPGAGRRAAIARAVAALGRHALRTGLVPLLPALKVGLPGEGNHVGATFPMRRAPGPLETDRLGALPGLPGVHLIDASVLPTLPAPTLTLTVMANAHRIATEVVCASR